ncbi:MAG: ABC transporter ATP-binding protein [Desulfomonile tiedjei]|uniref:ABC transporter ATP-binding protein n=1 Tax=Desulfomonile tiedjei TaxID=2358 RepID=A0A9D6UZ21_9BACT|nr:ABC transporter ATP-binding protein [Desulfomonile tiedjei]
MTDSFSTKPAISVHDVTKTYRLYPKPIDRFKEALWRGRRKYCQEFQALTNITFDMMPGTTLGIIGLNGSGKSTLLQIIAGTVRPTAGTVDVRGRLTALLELGAGFNSDYTGRENALLNGSIIGFSNGQMAEMLPEIEEFAAIGEFFDQPVKTYSSGMIVRLAFAVATVADPDIMLIDEALAVGDAPFQTKCYQRLRKYQEWGKSFIFVSHDTGAVQQLCTEAMLLDKGRVVAIGQPDDITNLYQRMHWEHEVDQVPACEGSGEVGSHGDGSISIQGCWVNGSTERQLPDMRYGDEIHMIVRARFNKDVDRPIVGLQVRTMNGFHVGGNTNWYDGDLLPPHRAGSIVDYEIKFPVVMTPNTYSLSPGLAYETRHGVGYADMREAMFIFKVYSNKMAHFGLVEFGMQISECGDAKKPATATETQTNEGRRQVRL